MASSQLNELQETAFKLYIEYQAIYCMVNLMTVQIKKDFKKTEESIINLSKPELRKFTNTIKKEINYLRRHYGAKVPNVTFVGLAHKAEESTEGRIYLFPKYYLKDFFTRYDRVIPDFKKLPDHIRIGIDPGKIRREQGSAELYLLEATIFEDMCAVFNLAMEFYKNLDRKKDSKKKLKTCDSLSRASIAAAFYFVESYLNGLAFDYYICNESKLDEKEKSILTEWDFNKNKQKYITLRDKLLQYPRIILGVDHPPMQESNCPEMSFLLERAKDLRDSIVHASPKPNLLTFDAEKESIFYNTDFNEVIKVVDNSVNLIEKIENRIYGNCGRLWWFYKRDENGYFPEKVFE